jgi:hypothetical protein
MAINLSQLSRPKADRPVIMTVFGEAGVGKTTLAAMMPKPVFIRTEDGTASLIGHDDAMLFPVAMSSQDVLDAIEALATQDHDRQTLVIDSITQLATLIESEIVRADPKAKSINQAGGGYGAGYGAASERHRLIREYAGELSEARGMNIVFIGHAKTESVSLPDMDDYMRYTIDMHKGSVPHYVNNVDAVCLVRLKSFTRGEDGKKKAISTQEREIIAYPLAACVSKNRFGVSEPIDFSFGGGNPFAPFLPTKG